MFRPSVPLFGALLLLLGTSMVLGQEARDYRLAAFDKMDRGDYQGAIADCSKAIALEPDEASNYRGRADARLALKDLDGAIADYTQALALFALPPKGVPGEMLANSAAIETQVNAYSRRAEAKEGKGDRPGALADLDKAVQTEPRQLSSYYLRGKLRAKLRDHNGAIADFTKYLGTDDPEGYYLRGLAYHNIDDYSSAEADFTKYIATESGDANGYWNRGLVRKALKNYPGAIADFTKVEALAPRFANAPYQRGMVYYSQKNYAATIPDLTKALELKPDYAEAAYYLGYAHGHSGKIELAMADFDRAQQLGYNQRGSFTALYYARGFFKMEAKDYDGAIGEFSEALKLAPKGYPFWIDRAKAKQAKGDFSDALADLNTGLALIEESTTAPARPDIYRDTLRQRATILRAQGNEAGAKADLDKAAELEASAPKKS